MTAAMSPSAIHQPPPCDQREDVMLASIVAIQPATASRTDAETLTIAYPFGTTVMRGRSPATEAGTRSAVALAQTSGTASPAPASATDHPPARSTSRLRPRCSSSSAALRLGQGARPLRRAEQDRHPASAVPAEARQGGDLVLGGLAEHGDDHPVASGPRQGGDRLREVAGAAQPHHRQLVEDGAAAAPRRWTTPSRQDSPSSSSRRP